MASARFTSAGPLPSTTWAQRPRAVMRMKGSVPKLAMHSRILLICPDLQVANVGSRRADGHSVGSVAPRQDIADAVAREADVKLVVLRDFNQHLVGQKAGLGVDLSLDLADGHPDLAVRAPALDGSGRSFLDVVVRGAERSGGPTGRLTSPSRLLSPAPLDAQPDEDQTEGEHQAHCRSDTHVGPLSDRVCDRDPGEEGSRCPYRHRGATTRDVHAARLGLGARGRAVGTGAPVARRLPSRRTGRTEDQGTEGKESEESTHRHAPVNARNAKASHEAHLLFVVPRRGQEYSQVLTRSGFRAQDRCAVLRSGTKARPAAHAIEHAIRDDPRFCGALLERAGDLAAIRHQLLVACATRGDEILPGVEEPLLGVSETEVAGAIARLEIRDLVGTAIRRNSAITLRVSGFLGSSSGVESVPRRSS